MAEIADFLPQDDELGSQLRGNASEFRAQLAASVAACTASLLEKLATFTRE